MKSVMTLWKPEFLNPNPFSPVHKALKFSAVFGTTSANNSKFIFPTLYPLQEISKNTRGLLLEAMLYN